MLYHNIMVPYDGSPSADAALAEAVRFAQQDSALTLRVVQIADVRQLAIERLEQKDAPSSVVSESVRIAFEEAFEIATSRLHNQIDGFIDGLTNHIVFDVLEETHPGSQIVAYAEENNCDLIIMGSRGLSGLRGILGSVSSHVLSETDIPVLVLKDRS